MQSDAPRSSGSSGAGSRVSSSHGMRPGSSVGSCPARSRRSCRPRGWRIYTIGTSIPRIDPARVPAHDRRRRRARDDLHARRPQRAAAAPSRSPTSTASRAGASTTSHWKGVRFRRPARARPAVAAAAKALRFVSAEVPYDDTLTLEQALSPDAMLAYEHGRQAALAAARVPGARRDAADVRLQERQVGDADRARDATTTRSATGSSAATTRTPGSAGRTVP